MNKIYFIVLIMPFILSWHAKSKWYRIIELEPQLVLVNNANDADTLVIGGENYEIIFERDHKLCNFCIGCAIEVNETHAAYTLITHGSSIDCKYELSKFE